MPVDHRHRARHAAGHHRSEARESLASVRQKLVGKPLADLAGGAGGSSAAGFFPAIFPLFFPSHSR
ncbi:hypothetical protein B0919_04995 [Hymenobacter sp. CRA2]|nr:hypothetical protein B0919_04995 [Hymenobacter sp. CRA2]